MLMVFLTIALFLFYGEFTSDSILPLVVFIFFISFFLFWLVWGEMRTKILKVVIDNDRIVVTNFQGLGSSKVFYFSEIDGYSTIVLPSEYEDFEYLYVMKQGRKVIKISDFYHANYRDLKREISGKCKNLGVQKFSLVQEFREIFST
jgi:hypothetical protein